MKWKLAYIGQAAVYAAFAVLIGHFSTQPTYSRLAPDEAEIKLALAHGGQPITECHRRSHDELKKLAANMRKVLDCPRERVPLLVELRLDGNLIFSAELPPTGLRRDGPSRLYERFQVPSGRHHLEARLRDSRRTEGFDYIGSAEVTLRPGQNQPVDFDPNRGGFVFD